MAHEAGVPRIVCSTQTPRIGKPLENESEPQPYMWGGLRTVFPGLEFHNGNLRRAIDQPVHKGSRPIALQ
jgi:hypothetical protein